MAITESPTRIASNAAGRGPRGAAPNGPDGKAAVPPKKAGKRKLVVRIAGIVVVLLVAGVGAKMTLLAPAKPAAPAKPQPGPVIAMTDMTLNLTGGHFLRLKIALQTTKGTADDLDTSEAAQLVIAQFSDQSVQQLTGNTARMKAKDELLKKLQQSYPKKILDVFYTEFVMQ